ncbi:MAG TPA: hypothetical protein DCM54_12415 [Gammaproteobacteria bacterium]|nr:hypothetical protein [Gammaproteobacteria bacterium]
MTLGIIELNDSGIQVAVDGDLVATSPGYAVLDGEKLLVGNEGAQFSRLLPTWTNNRFWNQLNTDPIPNATGAVRHHADLAFAHLESLWEQIKDSADQVIFLVPGFYDRSNLGLLLGMAKECNIPTAGIVDTSLATASEQALRETVLHLDIHLHRITLTRLANTANLSRTDFTTVSESGIFTLWDRWANVIANQFIQSSRYDPMHEAGSEQALYNQLPGWITNLETSRSNSFNLDLDNISHSVAISAEQLMAACTPLYPQIVQSIRNQVRGDETATLLMSHRFRGFPGLKDSLNLLENVDVVELTPEQAIQGALTHAEKIIPGSGTITHVVNLPITATKVVDDIVKTRRATHMLYENHAVSIGQSFKLSADFSNGVKQDLSARICTIYPRGAELYIDIHSAENLWINDAPATEQASLQPGDIIRVGDHSITLISSS